MVLEEIEVDGSLYKSVVNTNLCTGCAFYPDTYNRCTAANDKQPCTMLNRSDRTNIIWVRAE